MANTFRLMHDHNPVCSHDDIIQLQKLHQQLYNRLGSSGRQLINVQFRHDCFRFVFSHCSNKKWLYFSDFRHSYLFPGWEQCIKNHETQKNTGQLKLLQINIKWIVLKAGHYLDSNGMIVKKDTTFKEIIRYRVRWENF